MTMKTVVNIRQECKQTQKRLEPVQMSKGDRSSLHKAVTKGDIVAVHAFLVAEPDLSAVDLDGNTPLHLAIKKDQADIALLLISAGANVDALDGWGRAPLHSCPPTDSTYDRIGSNGKVVIFRALIAAGAHVSVPIPCCETSSSNYSVQNDEDMFGLTPLHIASVFGDEEAIKILLDNGADIDAKDFSGSTPLALAGGSTATILLLHEGAKNGVARLCLKWNLTKRTLNSNPLFT